MNAILRHRILQCAINAGYSDSDIYSGIAYADHIGYDSDDEALSLVIGRILYGEDECNNGARFPVEHGSDW